MKTIDELIAAFERVHDRESIALAHYLQGQACYQAGRFAEARSYFENGLQIEQERVGLQQSSALTNRLQIARAVLLAHGNYRFSEALAILNELIAAGNLGTLAGEAQIEKGYCLLRLGQLEKAELEIRRSLALLRDQRQPSSLARGLQYLGLVLWRHPDPDFVKEAMKEATQVMLEAAELARDNPSQRSQISDSLGRVYSRLGKYTMAVRWFKTSLKDKEAVDDRSGMAISYGGLGEAHLRAGQFDAAIESYLLDLELVNSSTPRNHFVIGQLHCLLAECYRRKGDFGRAVDCLKRAEKLADELPPEQRLISWAYVHFHRGRLVAQRGRFEEALTFFQKAEKGFLEADYTSVLAALRVGIGEVQIRLKNFDAAGEALEWAEVHESDPYELQFLYQALAELARLENDQERFNLYVARNRYLVKDFEGNLGPQFVPKLPKQMEEYRLRILAEPDKIIQPNELVVLSVQVQSTVGKPCPGMEVDLLSPSLEEQGGRVRPAGRLCTDRRGMATWRIQTGSRDRKIALEIRTVAASVKTEVHFRVYAISVLGAPDRAETLLKMMFCGLTKDILVEKKVYALSPGSFSLRASCRLQQDQKRSRKVKPLIKIGPQEEMLAERDAYNRNIDRMKATLSPILLAYADRRDSGGIAYVSRTRSQLSRLVPLVELASERNFSEINQVLEMLFSQRLAALYEEIVPSPGILATSYAPLEGYSAGKMWESIKTQVKDGIIEDEGANRIAIKFPRHIECPDPFALYEHFLRKEQPALKTFVHGNLRAQNVWVDQGSEVWIMDWRNAGEKHAVFDFICLESDLRLQAARAQTKAFRDIAQWFQLEDEALAYFERGCTDRSAGGAVTFKANVGDPVLSRIYHSISKIRTLAVANLGSADCREYLRGLLCHTARLLQEVKSASEISILLALSIALSKSLSDKIRDGE